MTTTPILVLDELASGQAIPESTVNENNRWFELFCAGGKVLDRDLVAQPGSPSDGDAYLLTATPTGANWSGQGGKVALFISTAWAFKTPTEGMRLYVADEDVLIVYDGSAWGVTGGTPYTDEQARDTIGTALTAGTGITKTVNDGADTITLALESLANLRAAGLQVQAVPSTQSGTTYTAVLGDAGGYIQFTNASAVAFTIPPNSSVAFPIGTTITFEQNGAGVVTLTTAGTTVFNSRGALVATGGQYAVVQIKKVATNTWTVIGDVA